MFCLLLFLAASCRSPGTVVGPLGHLTVRTALFRPGLQDGRPELFVFLSNGEFPCGLPDFDDPQAQARAMERLAVATCREGAQHVSLTLFARQPEWTGVFVGSDDASVVGPTATVSQVARGRYLGVEEAYLSDLDGLVRGYTPQSVTTLDPLGDGGEVVLEPGSSGRLSGTFRFPDSEGGVGVYGTFEASACDPDRVDASLLDSVQAAPLSVCSF
ncbi:MAG: hypothetical protein KTR31_28555 [Myxococcales bacterium]|nr:hypothetical protein [Myxococcales bacterium]